MRFEHIYKHTQMYDTEGERVKNNNMCKRLDSA